MARHLGRGPGRRQIFDVPPAAEIVARLKAEYDAARAALFAGETVPTQLRSGGVARFMSLYEILAVVVLVGAGGFAYHLYRSDTRPKSPGGKAPEDSGQPTNVRANAWRTVALRARTGKVSPRRAFLPGEAGEVARQPGGGVMGRARRCCP